MGNICGDNRFEIIAKAKKNLLKSTNIHTSEDEMKVLDSFLFRCWQMGWLERYDKPREPLDIPTMSTDFIKEYGLPCPEGYIFKDENGNVINARKIVLEKKKKEYPKTFVDCCAILYPNDNFQSVSQRIKGHKGDLLFHFQKLLICRDAYWKIAGEEMGLGKPWEPDWNNISDKYCIYFVSGDVWSKECQTRQCPFAFPTPEMRDAFRESFDKDLEFCKDLL